MKSNPGQVPLETSGPDDTFDRQISKSFCSNQFTLAKLENLDIEISNIKDPDIK